MPELTAGWPFEAVRSAKSAEATEANLDMATSLQNMPNSKDVWNYLNKYPGDHLLVSPYLSQEHLLDLQTVGKQEQLMAKALMVMAPVKDDYGTASYHEAFNWTTVIDALQLLVRAESFAWRKQHFYVIAFRSLLAPEADYARLIELDEKAHVEATKSGGLLKYWFGEPDINRRNLATCKILLRDLSILPHTNYSTRSMAPRRRREKRRQR